MRHCQLPLLVPGVVHAAALAKAQIVLHLRDKQPALAAHAAADDAGVEALLVIETEVLPRERDVRLIRLRAPEGKGRVVVRAGVADAVELQLCGR